MKVELIEYFTALENTTSMSEAAEKVYLTQQGFSRAISSLESAVGHTLVERSNQGARLTDKGELFMRHAKSITAEYHTALEELNGHDSITAFMESFSGNIAFTNAAMICFGRFMLDEGMLNHANIREIAYSELERYLDDPDWLLVADISPEIYQDLISQCVLMQIGVGAMGVVTHERLLSDNTEIPLWESLRTMPLATLDCEGFRNIFRLISEEIEMEEIRLNTMNINVLEKMMASGSMAIFTDEFSWRCLPKHVRSQKELRFVPLKRKIFSIFGFFRKGSLSFTEEERLFIQAFCHMVTMTIES